MSPVTSPTPEHLRPVRPLAEAAGRILLQLTDDHPAATSATVLQRRVALVSGDQIARTLTWLGELGWIDASGHLLATADAMRQLGWRLRGLADAASLDRDLPQPELIITEPRERSQLGAYLRRSGLRPSAFRTHDAFRHLARTAQRSFVIATPFLDHAGATLATELFAAAICPEKRLILRQPTHPRAIETWQAHAPAIQGQGVDVFTYGSSPPGQQDTFHAKFLLADEQAAYIGSANLLESALEQSLECGVLLGGSAVRELYRVARAMLSVAVRVL